MLFAIYARDHANALEKRLAVYPAHRAYLEQSDQEGSVKIVMSGPLVQDDGHTMHGFKIGSFIA
jgi:uncharacterized protein